MFQFHLGVGGLLEGQLDAVELKPVLSVLALGVLDALHQAGDLGLGIENAA